MFYVVRKPHGYLVCEARPEAVFRRTKEDPTLNARLDRTPFATRTEVESRCEALLAEVRNRAETQTQSDDSAGRGGAMNAPIGGNCDNRCLPNGRVFTSKEVK
jgi:hypothetical protein